MTIRTPNRLKAGLRTLTQLACVTAVIFSGCGGSERVVVVYTSQDQVYAEPLLNEFAQKTGIKVLPVFDSESVKTAGLAQRLLAEKANPRADIFWSNEEMLSWHLAEMDALEKSSWAKGGYRTRRMIVNTNALPLAKAPKSLEELTDPKWAGRVAMAYPVYGTTAAHMVALRQAWGDAKWKAWCEKLSANRPLIVDGNSVVVRLVGNGEAWIGLTDSDDFAGGIEHGFPIASVPATDEFLAIPTSVGIVRGAPHPKEAKEFLEFALSKSALEELVKAKALEGVESKQNTLKLKQPAAVDETREILQKLFARQ